MTRIISTPARVSGPEYMAAVGNALDARSNNYAIAAFYLGVSAGQLFSSGWSAKQIDEELTSLARSHPRLAADIRRHLAATPAQSSKGE